MMSEERTAVTDKILNYTLEILFLLTGEDYVVVKKHVDHTTDSSSLYKLGAPARTPSCVLTQPDKKLMIQRILQITNKIIHVLTAEGASKTEVEDSLLTPEEMPPMPHAPDTKPDVVKMEVGETSVKLPQQERDKEAPVDLSAARSTAIHKILVKMEPQEMPCVSACVQSVEKKIPGAISAVRAENVHGVLVKSESEEVPLLSSQLLSKQNPILDAVTAVQAENVPGVVVKMEPVEMPCVRSQLLSKEKPMPAAVTAEHAENIHEIVVKMEPDEIPMDQQPPKEAPPAAISTDQPVKKARKAIDLDCKLKVIRQYEGGKKVNMIARDLKLSHSTVSTILKDRERIREAVKGSAPMRCTILTKQRQGPIHEMEKLLFTWMEDLLQKRAPLSFHAVQAKARRLFQTLKSRAGHHYARDFQASTGWFKRFKQRFALHHVRVTGESASADEGGAHEFVERFDALLKEEGYVAEQIFNVEETGLQWKWRPTRTYVQQEAKPMPGFKAFKDRLTLLLGGNAAGFKLKPFLIDHSENSGAYKHINQHTLPIQKWSNRKAKMTPALFKDWFMNCFIPQARGYCADRGVPFKILLILDNTPSHPPHLDDLHHDVRVVFMPPNTSALIQPMDQGAISTFKAHYLRTTLAQATEAVHSGAGLSLPDFWEQYDILQCIKNISSAWESVSNNCMSGVWKKCIKSSAERLEDFQKEEELEVIRENIVTLAESLELECDVEDVEELLDCETKELSDEELIELEAQRVAEENEEEEEDEPVNNFTTKGLSDSFTLLSKALASFQAMDPNVERYAKVERTIQEAVRCYYEIYEGKKRQTVKTKLSRFLLRKRSTVTQEQEPGDPEPGTSRMETAAAQIHYY